MCSTKLKEDLCNCLINFDRRVLITELLDDYQLSYEEVNTTVNNYLKEQEDKVKLKFERRYLVHGLSASEKEVYQIVEEPQLKEWLKKLQNSESSLYSVEVAGGAKAAATVFKPMSIAECVRSKTRRGPINCVNGEPERSSVDVDKQPAKEEKPKHIHKQSPKTTPKTESSAKKCSPKADTTPPERKADDKKTPLKKGINNFFTSATNKTKNSDDVKSKTGVIKPPTPKKMMDFFKKQTEKSASTTENKEKPVNNTSVQLFDDNEEEPDDVESSSDEEEKLEALKRDIISCEMAMEDEEDESKQTVKRRRILDSDDEEEDRPVKQEKLDIKEESIEKETVAETYLDDEGFVITKKPKQKATSSSHKPTAAKKTPPVTIKTSPKTKKQTSSKQTIATPTAKTKQAGIMNFFSKR